MSARRMVPRDGTLADAVLEIDSQIEPGDTTQNVELTGAAWDRLVGMAQDKAASEDGWKEAVELALSEKPDSALSGPWTSHKRALELRKRIVSVARSVLEPKMFEPLPPPRPKKQEGAPFRVFVDGVHRGDLTFDDRNEAVGWAKGCGFNPFEVRRADGTVCDVVDVPPAKKRKPRAVKAFCAKCNDTTKHDGNDECTKCASRELFDAQQKAEDEKRTPLEQAIDAAGGGA